MKRLFHFIDHTVIDTLQKSKIKKPLFIDKQIGFALPQKLSHKLTFFQRIRALTAEYDCLLVKSSERNICTNLKVQKLSMRFPLRCMNMQFVILQTCSLVNDSTAIMSKWAVIELQTTEKTSWENPIKVNRSFTFRIHFQHSKTLQFCCGPVIFPFNPTLRVDCGVDTFIANNNWPEGCCHFSIKSIEVEV